MHRTRILRVLAAGLALAATAASANLVDNPGFETGDFTSWTAWGQGWRTAGGGDAYEGSYGLINDVLTSDVDEWRGIYQDISITAGLFYDAGVYIRAVNVESSSSFLELQWRDSLGDQVGSTLATAWVSSDQAFTYLGFSNIEAPAGAVSARLQGVVNMSSAPGDTDFHNFDNFTMTQVPEPGTMALLAVGAAGMALRRRRSR
jgi:hypothetical protein